MNKLITGILTAGVMLTGAGAFAQDSQMNPATSAPSSSSASSDSATSTASSSSTSSSPSKHQMMKDCMTRQAAKNDGSTKMQIKKACKDEMKSGVATDSSMSSTSK
jgi:hypothetical protein